MKLFRKTLLIFSIMVLLFTATVIKPQTDIRRAEAFAFLPQLGVGAYATAVLVGAGALTLVGSGDNAAKLVEHAGSVWDGMTSASQKAWNGMVKVAKLGLNGAEVDTLEMDFSGLTMESLEDVQRAASATSYNAGKSYQRDVPTTAYPEAQLTTHNNRDGISFPASSPYGFVVVHPTYGSVIFTKGFSMSYNNLYTYPEMGYGSAWRGSTYWENPSKHPWANIGSRIFSAFNIKTVEDFVIEASAGIASKIVIMTRAEYDANMQAYNDAIVRGKAGITNSVPKVTIPIESISALNPDLTWDGVNYKNPAGDVVNWNDLTMPMPEVTKDGKVGVAVPGQGVVIDTTTGDVVGDYTANPPADGGGADGGISDGTFSSFWDWLKGILTAIRDGIKNLAALTGIITVIQAIGNAFDDLTSWTDTFFASAAATLSDGLANLDTFAEEFWGSFTDSLALGLTGITDFTTTFWDTYTDSFAKGLEGIGIDSISQGIDNIGTWTNEFWDSYTDSFAAGLSGIDTFVTEFWGSFTGAMSGALSGINTFIKDFGSIIAGLFIPTLALGTWWTAVNEAFNKRFILPELDDFMGFTDLACIGVQDMYAEIFGKRVKVFEGSYLIEYSYWWKNIASGLMWFLAIWFVWRKVIGLFNRTGGATP